MRGATEGDWAGSVAGSSGRDLVLDQIIELSLYLFRTGHVWSPALFGFVENDISVEDNLEHSTAAATDCDIDVAAAGSEQFG